MIRGAFGAGDNALSHHEPNGTTFSGWWRDSDSVFDICFICLLVFAAIGIFTCVQWFFVLVKWVKTHGTRPQILKQEIEERLQEQRRQEQRVNDVHAGASASGSSADVRLVLVIAATASGYKIDRFQKSQRLLRSETTRSA